jgi:hypothetical protein
VNKSDKRYQVWREEKWRGVVWHATISQLLSKNHEHSRGNRARAETSSLRDGLFISFKRETILFLHTFIILRLKVSNRLAFFFLALIKHRHSSVDEQLSLGNENCSCVVEHIPCIFLNWSNLIDRLILNSGNTTRLARDSSRFPEISRPGKFLLTRSAKRRNDESKENRLCRYEREYIGECRD